MNEPLEVIEYRGYKIEVHLDPEPINPREPDYCDHLGTMACFHRRYHLGDWDVWQGKMEDFKDWLKENEHEVFQLPLYLYDHSGLTMNTTGFSCKWDSGQVGVIYVEKAKALKEFGSFIETNPEKVFKRLEAEVKEYDDYLTGNVFGYRVINPDGNDGDSCWGFVGDDGRKDMIEQVKARIDSQLKDENSKRNEEVQL